MKSWVLKPPPSRQRPQTVSGPPDLVLAHMPLVRRIAWSVHRRIPSTDVADLVQLGMVALVEAAQNYEDRGHAFATYASLRVRGAMIDSVRRSALLSRSAIAGARLLADTRRMIESTLGRPASEEEMASALDLDLAGYRAMAQASEPPREESLDQLYSDQSPWFADLSERVDEAIDRAELAAILTERIAELPEREAMVLQLYFVEDLSLREIGEVLGVGAARICQIKRDALEKLRATLAPLMDI